MKQLTVNYSIKISEIQHETLQKLKQKYKTKPSHFIRQAISEKLQREKLEIKQKIKKSDVPF